MSTPTYTEAQLQACPRARRQAERDSDRIPKRPDRGIDVCALANNHVLDWGHQGLADTLATLRQGGIATELAQRRAHGQGASATATRGAAAAGWLASA